MEFPDVGNRNFQRRKFRLCRLLASGGGVWYHAYVSDSRKRLVFDIVLRSPLGEGGHRAEADRVIRGGQNLGKPCRPQRQNEEPEIPERTPATLRIQRKVASSEKTANLTAEAKYDGASRGNHAAYFLFMFLQRFLAVPPTRQEFRECAAQFVSGRCLFIKQKRRTKEIDNKWHNSRSSAHSAVWISRLTIQFVARWQNAHLVGRGLSSLVPLQPYRHLVLNHFYGLSVMWSNLSHNLCQMLALIRLRKGVLHSMNRWLSERRRVCGAKRL